MKKLLLSRRGAAIEMAIGVMLLMIAVSIVLLTLSTIKHDRKEDDVAQLENRIELMQITDYIIANPEETEYRGYSISFTDEIQKVNIDEGSTILRTYTVLKDGETVLSFEALKTGDNPYEIISWK